MKVIENTPIWVTLAYGNVETRKVALILVLSSLVFTVYCVPWVHYSKATMVAKLFLLDDWSWFAMMLPMTLWYWLGMRWVDKHQGWQ